MNVRFVENYYSATNPPTIGCGVGLFDPDLKNPTATKGQVAGFVLNAKDVALVVIDDEPDVQRRIATDSLWRLAR